MKTIILDAYQHDATITGTDRMAYNFLRELQILDKTNIYTVLCSSEDYIPSVITEENFKVLRPWLNLKQSTLRRISNKLWRELTTLRLRIHPADVFYSFHNMRLPRFNIADRMIASNLDLIVLKIKEYAGAGRLSAQQELSNLKKVALRASEFVSISNFSKAELIKTLSVKPQNVTVVPLAADPYFNTTKNNTALRELPGEFMFTLGGSEPRKNVQAVVKAFCELPKKTQRRFPLYIGGGEWHAISLDTFKVNENIHILGYLKNDALAEIYKRASLFIFASRYEGFGFTILEAMASGSPVLYANNTSLPEVAGESAIAFDSENSNDLSKKINLVLQDDALRKKLSLDGRTRANQFSWLKSAKKLHGLLTQ